MKLFKLTSMMTRFVRLSFQVEHREAFLEIFAKHKISIQDFEGLQEIKLLEEMENPGVFFTHSIWDSHVCLENYRDSAYFRKIWSTIKPWFNERAQAWSLEEK